VTSVADRLTPRSRWRARLHEVIFEADTPAGRAFDVGLLVAILVSVVAVMLESVAEIRREYGGILRVVEWTITIAFTIEYALRLAAVDRPWRYARSFFGLVDLLAIAPTYLALLMPEAQSLIVIRTIRLLRVFRILKLVHFLGEAQQLAQALHASRRKITVFLGAVVSTVVIMGTLMYLVEGEEHGFTSIPTSMY
jgi:voltage-gated potassium channel